MNFFKVERKMTSLVWKSFGVVDTVLKFLDVLEVIQFQLTNKFAYDVAVSRVQVSIRFKNPIYFTHFRRDKSFLLSYERGNRSVKLIDDDCFDFKEALTLQIGCDLFVLK